MKTKTPLLLLSLLGGLLLTSYLSAQTEKGDKEIENRSMVSLEYTLSDEKGKVIESNKGKEPLSYTQGQGSAHPGAGERAYGHEGRRDEECPRQTGGCLWSSRSKGLPKNSQEQRSFGGAEGRHHTGREKPPGPGFSQAVDLIC